MTTKQQAGLLYRILREEFYNCFEKYYMIHKEKMNNKIITKLELVFEEKKNINITSNFLEQFFLSWIKMGF